MDTLDRRVHNMQPAAENFYTPSRGLPGPSSGARTPQGARTPKGARTPQGVKVSTVSAI